MLVKQRHLQRHFSNSVFKVSMVIVLILAFLFSPAALNMVVSYSISGGSVFEKLHPFSYFVILAWLVDFLFVRGGRFKLPDRNFYLAAAWAAIVAYLVIFGDFGYATVLMNNFFFPIFFVSLLARFERQELFQLGLIFLWLMAFQSLFVFIEHFAGRTLVPIVQEAGFFRPAGFAGHPLVAGQLALLGIVATRFLVDSPTISRGLILFFLLSLFVIGSRFALLVGLALVVVELARPYRVRSGFGFGFISLILIFFAILFVLIVVEGGSIDRLLERGIWNSSSKSRFEIFYVFEILSTEEIFYGVELGRVQQYLSVLGQSHIESPFVAQMVFAGIFVAFIAHLLILFSFVPMLRVSPIFFFMLVLFLGFSLIFSSKGQGPLLIYFVFYIGLAMSTSSREDLQNRSLPLVSENETRPRFR